MKRKSLGHRRENQEPMANKSKSSIVVFLEVCLSDLVQNICQKLIAYDESLKCAEFGGKKDKRKEELTVQARILDASSLLGASRPVRVKRGNKDEGGSDLWKSQETFENLRKSYEISESCRNYRRVKMNSGGSYL